MRSITIVTALTLASLPGVSRAQAPASPSTPHPPSATQDGGNQRCAPTALPDQNTRPGVTTGQSDSAPLSDRLSAGNGVLCPPSNVDPEIRAPTPDVGKTPVIPPPGSPGGDQSVQPK